MTAETMDGYDQARLQQLGVDGVMRELTSRVRCPEHPDTTAAQKRALAAGVRIIERAEAIHGNHDGLGNLKSMMLGKLGRFDEAIANARARHDRAPTWATAVSLANALRRSKDTTGAIAAFRAAAAIDPTDATALLDVGDMLLAGEDWGGARAAYEQALEREPGQAWAAPSACYARYRESGDADALTGLRHMAGGHAETCECGMSGVLRQLLGTYSDHDKIERAKELLARVEPPAKRKTTKKKTAKKKAPAPKKNKKAPVPKKKKATKSRR
jgi:tetratricopeptide (TPR) repeat protein